MPIPLLASAGVSLIGGLLKTIGAGNQASEAQRQLDAQRSFATSQKSAFDTGAAGLLAGAKGLSTYTGDLSAYAKAERAAEEAKRSAGVGRVAGEDIMREQARQTTANTLAAAKQGARSGTDLLTAALFAQNQENAQMQDINVQTQQQRQQQAQLAQQNYLAQLGESAAAKARESGLEFQSLSNRENTILNTQAQNLQAGMNLQQSLFQQEQAKAGALADAKAAIWSGLGGIGSQIGSGMMSLGMNQMNLDALAKMNNIGQATNTAGSFLSPFAGAINPTQAMQTLNPLFGQQVKVGGK